MTHSLFSTPIHTSQFNALGDSPDVSYNLKFDLYSVIVIAVLYA